MVEGARLESVYRGDSIVGSNPTVSASYSIISMACGEYVGLPTFVLTLVSALFPPTHAPFKNVPNETPAGWLHDDA